MYQRKSYPVTNRCPDRVRLLIADDHAIVRQGLRVVIEDERDIEVVGEAEDGAQAISMAEAKMPDVVLLDIHMPKRDGFEVAREIKSRLPGTGVVMMTAFDEDEQLLQAVRAGASAFFLKDVQPSRLADGIRRAAACEYLIGESVWSRPLVASRILREFRELNAAASNVQPLYCPLSARETEVLELVASGKSNKEIGRALSISPQTVKNHMTAILRKLDVNDRTQAVTYALRRGWIKLPD